MVCILQSVLFLLLSFKQAKSPLQRILIHMEFILLVNGNHEYSTQQRFHKPTEFSLGDRDPKNYAL
jgi:hypothetical protein